MGQNFDDYSGFQQTPGMPILVSVKVELSRKLYENIYIFEPQKRIVSAETIRGNTLHGWFPSLNIRRLLQKRCQPIVNMLETTLQLGVETDFSRQK